jgi:hypothetical protein
MDALAHQQRECVTPRLGPHAAMSDSKSLSMVPGEITGKNTRIAARKRPRVRNYETRNSVISHPAPTYVSGKNDLRAVVRFEPPNGSQWDTRTSHS